MDKNVGVGAIVGLVLVSSVYVWNSNSFNVTQKTLLLICIIFPPAQWLGILLILLFNNFQENNSSEKIQSKNVTQTKANLHTSIMSLTELREKGILTDNEFYEKVAKIKTEDALQEVKASKEYKQLKSLFESGVLTKEEFERKILLINPASAPIGTTRKEIHKKVHIKKDQDMYDVLHLFIYGALAFFLYAVIISLIDN